MPIDRVLIGCLLARGDGLLDGDLGRALGNGRRWGNFSATRVRHYLTAGGAKVAHPACRSAPSVEALPMPLLGCATGDGTLQMAAFR
jgi:hypothetical protein